MRAGHLGNNPIRPPIRGVSRRSSMQKNVLTKAVAVALATLGTAGVAVAQSSVTIYGNADVSVDHVSRSKGVAPTATKYSATRVSPSASSQTSFGFKGVED